MKLKQQNQYFILFNECIPVKGHRRSIICDLRRNTYLFIPNSLYSIIYEHQRKTPVKEVYSLFSDEETNIIDSYFQLMIDNELVFFTDDSSRFPPPKQQWESPLLITNAIIDTDNSSQHDYKNIFATLDELGCKSVQLRFFHPIKLQQLKEILSHSTKGRLSGIELVLHYSSDISEKSVLEDLWVENKRISNILIHSAPNPKGFIISKQVFVDFIEKQIESEAHCGVVNHSYFTANPTAFNESLKFNSCLNRKLSIDKHGYLRNCPSMPRSFGKFSNINVKEAVLSEAFQKSWFINKDQIKVCMDCEFRYICTDCRAYIENDKDILSKPSKCNYNPYTSTWET